MNKFYNYYNPSCSDGTASVSFAYDSTIISLKELLMFELQQIAYYVDKLHSLDVDMNKQYDKVIDFISLVVANLDFKRDKFEVIINDLDDNKQKLAQLYATTCDKLEAPQILLPKIDVGNKKKVFELNSINIFSNAIVSENKQALYDIIMRLVQSASRTLVELKEYGENDFKARDSIIKLLARANFVNDSDEDWVKDILEFAKENYRITLKLTNLLIEKYGPIEKKEVSTSPQKGKCILVTGHFYRDLEKILEATKDKNINIYTHSEMLMAHSYAELAKYENLKGHYQRSLNNINLDFATFPGPILITSNSVPQANLIRGQIYTIGSSQSFGFAKIKNDDFSSLIDYAMSSEGFGKDSREQKVSVGYDEDEIEQILKSVVDKLKNETVRYLFVLGSMRKYQAQDKYYLDFMKYCPKDCAVLSFSYKYDCENCYHINSYYDFSLIWGVLEKLNKECSLKTLPLTVFLTRCNSQTISNIFGLKTLGIDSIYLPSCYPNVINPNSIKVLVDMFDVQKISESPEIDINYILDREK